MTRPDAEDRQLFAWIPFGAGRHRCVGAAFAMIQLKAVLSSLLLRYRFEMAQPPDTYRNDHSRMVVQLEQPCVIRYRRRPSASATGRGVDRGHGADPGVADRRRRRRIEVDRDLCQAHAVCCSEAPDVFELGDDRKVRVLVHEPDPDRLDAVHQAVRYCPTGALSLLTTDPEPTMNTVTTPRRSRPMAHDRAELEEMLHRFEAANDEAGRTGDWSPLGDFYTDDALYSWNNGPRHEFVARGPQQIVDWVLGTEMEGLEGWEYPYVRKLIDDSQDEVVVFWRQIAPSTGPNGEPLRDPRHRRLVVPLRGRLQVGLAARLLRPHERRARPSSS